jgi:hypothetical protein
VSPLTREEFEAKLDDRDVPDNVRVRLRNAYFAQVVSPTLTKDTRAAAGSAWGRGKFLEPERLGVGERIAAALPSPGRRVERFAESAGQAWQDTPWLHQTAMQTLADFRAGKPAPATEAEPFDYVGEAGNVAGDLWRGNRTGMIEGAGAATGTTTAGLTDPAAIVVAGGAGALTAGAMRAVVPAAGPLARGVTGAAAGGGALAAAQAATEGRAPTTREVATGLALGAPFGMMGSRVEAAASVRRRPAAPRQEAPPGREHATQEPPPNEPPPGDGYADPNQQRTGPDPSSWKSEPPPNEPPPPPPGDQPGGGAHEGPDPAEQARQQASYEAEARARQQQEEFDRQRQAQAEEATRQRAEEEARQREAQARQQAGPDPESARAQEEARRQQEDFMRQEEARRQQEEQTRREQAQRDAEARAKQRQAWQDPAARQKAREDYARQARETAERQRQEAGAKAAAEEAAANEPTDEPIDLGEHLARAKKYVEDLTGANETARQNIEAMKAKGKSGPRVEATEAQMRQNEEYLKTAQQAAAAMEQGKAPPKKWMEMRARRGSIINPMDVAYEVGKKTLEAATKASDFAASHAWPILDHPTKVAEDWVASQGRKAFGVVRGSPVGALGARVRDVLTKHPAAVVAGRIFISGEYGLPVEVTRVFEEARRKGAAAAHPLNQAAREATRLPRSERQRLDVEMSEPPPRQGPGASVYPGVEETMGPRSDRAKFYARLVDDASQQMVDVHALGPEVAAKHQGFYLPRSYAKNFPFATSIINAWAPLSRGLAGYKARGQERVMSVKDFNEKGDPWTLAKEASTNKFGAHVTLENQRTGEQKIVPRKKVWDYLSDWEHHGYRGPRHLVEKMEVLEAREQDIQADLRVARASKAPQAKIDELGQALKDNRAAQLQVLEKPGMMVAAKADYPFVQRKNAMGQHRDAAHSLHTFAEKVRRNYTRGSAFADLAKMPEWAEPAPPDMPVEAAEIHGKPMEDGRRWVYFGREKAVGGNVPKWGALAHHFVHPDIASYIRWNDDLQSIARHVKTMTGLNAWKRFKTLWSPAYHLNNFGLNVVPLEMSGGTVLDLLPAWKEIRENSELVQQLEADGTIRDGQVARDVAAALDTSTGTGGSWLQGVMGLPDALRDMVEARSGNVAQGVDDTFRVALVRGLLRRGMSYEDARGLAEKRFYKADRVTAHGANMVEAAWLPFAKPMWYWFENYPEMAVKNPIRAAFLVMWLLAFQGVVDTWNGTSREERQAMEAGMPANMKPIAGIPQSLPMPWKDGYGHPVNLDLSYAMPFSQVMGRYRGNVADPSAAAGVENWVNNVATPGGPFHAVGDAVRGYDPQMGRELRTPARDDTGAFLARSLAPTAAYDAYDKLAGAMSGRETYSGQRIDVPTAIANVAGVKLRPYDPEVALKQVRGKFMAAIHDVRGAIRRADVLAEKNPGEAAHQREGSRLREKLVRIVAEMNEQMGRIQAGARGDQVQGVMAPQDEE